MNYILKKAGFVVVGITAAGGITGHILRKRVEQETFSAELMEPIEPRKMGFYECYVKRGLDVLCATGAIVCFSPLYLIVTILVRIKLGSPVLFTQYRPGLVGDDGKERIFKIYKYRTMTDECDQNGNLMPDEVRLTSFGKALRATSLDELPEAFNILNGTMSVIGPRPQLVRDMVFMTVNQRKRHTAKPGLSGLAQVMGRNAIAWERKFDWDNEYIEEISFKKDVSIICQTVKNVFIQGESKEEIDVTDDYGDALLKAKKISNDQYNELLAHANRIINNHEDNLWRNIAF